MTSRRGFAVAALSAAAARVLGANDRVRLGVIGTGNRGQYVTEVFAANPDVAVAGLCDVFQANLDRAAQPYAPAERYRDYRRLLERKDVDAVLIATPDHWHGQMTAEACAAGKDVYCEKPVSNTIEGGLQLVAAANKYSQRVIQVGIQQRSWPHFLEAAKLTGSGQFGAIRQVMCLYPGGSRRRAGENSTAPEGLDWELFQGPAARKPYNEARQRSWRSFYDYGGGLITDWGVHLTDTAHMVMHDDQPLTAAASFLPSSAGSEEQAPDTFTISWTYRNTVMSFSNVMPAVSPDLQGWGVYVYGEQGMLQVNRHGYLTRPVRPLGRAGQSWKPSFEPALAKPPYNTGKFEAGTVAHVRNFLDCLKSRQKPNCDARTGFQSTLPTLLALHAVRSGRNVRWDGAQVYTT